MLDLFVLLGYFITLVFIGIKRSNKNMNFHEFAVTDRSLGFPQMTATIITTFYGATAIIGVAGFAFLNGLGAIWFCIPFYIGSLFMAFFLIKKISKFSKFTMPEAIGAMFDNRCRILSSGLLIFYCLIPESILASGYLLHAMSGVPVLHCMIVTTIVIIIYTSLGGLQAVVRTDILQFLLMTVGVAILTIIGLEHIGGFGGIWQNIPAGFKSISGGLSIWDILALSISMGTMPLISAPLYQRVFSASSWKVSRKALFTAILCWLIFDFAIITSGLIARVENPTGGPEAADSALPGLAMMILPPGLRAVLMVSLLAAVMSTADSYLHVAVCSFSNDIYGSRREKNGKKILVARGSTVVFGVLSLVIALWLKTIVNAIIFLLTVWISGMFLPLILSYKFKLRARTAFIGMLSGAIISISWKAISYFVAVPAYANPLFVGMGACLIGLVIAEKIWRP